MNEESLSELYTALAELEDVDEYGASAVLKIVKNENIQELEKILSKNELNNDDVVSYIQSVNKKREKQKKALNDVKKNELTEAWKQLGYPEIQEKSKTISDKTSQINPEIKKLWKLSKQILFTLLSKKRVSDPTKHVTLRGGGIYKYNKKKRAKISFKRAMQKHTAHIISCFDDNRAEAAKLINNLELIYNKHKEIKDFENITEYDGTKYRYRARFMDVKRKSYSNIGPKPFNKASIELRDASIEDRKTSFLTSEGAIRMFIELKPFIKESLNEHERLVDETLDTIETVKNGISKDFSKEIAVNKL